MAIWVTMGFPGKVVRAATMAGLAERYRTVWEAAALAPEAVVVVL